MDVESGAKAEPSLSARPEANFWALSDAFGRLMIEESVFDSVFRAFLLPFFSLVLFLSVFAVFGLGGFGGA